MNAEMECSYDENEEKQHTDEKDYLLDLSTDEEGEQSISLGKTNVLDNDEQPHEETKVTESLTPNDIQSFNSYELFRAALCEHECQDQSKFVIVRSSERFSDEVTPSDLVGKKSPRMLWEFCGKGDQLPIKFSGVPYMTLGFQEYYCHHGKDIHASTKRKYKDKKEDMMKFDHCMLRSRKLAQNTKKLDCPVKFVVKKIFSFEKYKLGKDTKRRRTDLSKQIKERLQETEKVKMKDRAALESFGQLQYLCIFPNPMDHQNHHIGEAAGISEPLDDRLADYLKKQIRGGCRRTKELQARAAIFVNDNLFLDQEKPSCYSRRFRPSRKKIKNLITAVKIETRFSKIDQENVEACKDKWAKWADVHYESAIKKEIVESDSDESDCEEEKEKEETSSPKRSTSTDDKLIFVFQSPNMKRLYQRYGTELLLLDATYKTTKYALPLFFAVVKTV